MYDVIIYGLGEGREYVEKCLNSKCRVTGYTDSYSKIQIFNGKRFYTLETLKDSGFDYIILAIENSKICKKIVTMLHEEYGISQDKVIDFWHLYYGTLDANMLDYRVMDSSDNIVGVILGLSHGEVGIDKDYLTGNWCNLAISSQDIYSNYKAFEYVYKRYEQRFKNLEYVVIDLFDYIYFNYDVSMAKNALNYIGAVKNISGITHNLNHNKMFNIEDVMIDSLSHEEYEVMNLLFCNLHYEEWIWRKYIKKKRVEVIDRDCDDYLKPDYMPAIAKKHFAGTIEENIMIFKKLLEMFYEINDNMRIYGVLIPRYIKIEEIHKTLYKDWKKEFLEIIEDIKGKYNNFKFLDFKDYRPISENNYFYKDASHLNQTGAAAFTSLLNQVIYC